MMDKKTLEKLFSIKIIELQPVSGGSINKTYKLTTEKQVYFLKINSSRLYPEMFQKEYNGLNKLKESHCITVPNPLKIIADDRGNSYFLMDFIERGLASERYWAALGNRLACLHRESHAKFGFDEDNYIGSLVQKNTYSESWTEFFIEQRILPLFKKAFDSGFFSRTDEQRLTRLFNLLPQIFPDEPPALLHGDLWSGNVMPSAKESPVLYDPAVYYGHREMDIAMTYLFGGFSDVFYNSYMEAMPIAPGFDERKDICNLYPLLVHVLLFGSGYVFDVRNTLSRF